MGKLNAEHMDFLADEAQSLLNFAFGSVMKSGGFGYMDTEGKVDTSKPRWVMAITKNM